MNQTKEIQKTATTDSKSNKLSKLPLQTSRLRHQRDRLVMIRRRGAPKLRTRAAGADSAITEVDIQSADAGWELSWDPWGCRVSGV